MPDDADRDYLLAICTAHFHKNSDGRFIFDNTRLIYTTYYGMAVETVTPDQAGQYQGGDLE